MTSARPKRYDGVDPTLFGAAVKKHRTAAGMSLRTLATRCNTSGPYLSTIESGKDFGNEAVLRCLRDTFGIDDSLFDLHFYQFGRISEELQFTDLGWAQARLDEFREILTVFRKRMRA